jgi:hypothetical protein
MISFSSNLTEFVLVVDGYLDVLKPKKSYTKKLNCTQCGAFIIHKYTTTPAKDKEKAHAKSFTDFKCVPCKSFNSQKKKKPQKKTIITVIDQEKVAEIKEEPIDENEEQKRNRKKIDFDEKCKKSAFFALTNFHLFS